MSDHIDHFSGGRKFLPAALHEKLAYITRYPVTVLEAPAGFGKTTALRTYLRMLGDENQRWYTCFGESVEKAWAGICGLLAGIGAEAARLLQPLGTPTEDNLVEIARVMRALAGDAPGLEETDTFLAIDNFEYVQARLPVRLAEVMAAHNDPRLHIIFITQNAGYSDARLWQSNRVHCIGFDCFFFAEADTDAYFRQHGIQPRSDEIAQIQKITWGWPAALNLQRLRFERVGRDTGLVALEPMYELVRTSFWNQLDAAQRDFILRVSVFERFTVNQAAIMLDAADLSLAASQLMETSAFIQRDSEGMTYALHPLLRGYSARLFRKRPRAAQKQIWRLAGRAYAAEDMNGRAMSCFFEAGAYDELLSLPMGEKALSDSGDSVDRVAGGFSHLVDRVMAECPAEILLRHPRALLEMALALCAAKGKGPALEKACRLVETLLDEPALYGLDQRARQRVAGEYARVRAFQSFNDLQKMGAGYEEALTLLEGPSELTVGADAWILGQPSLLHLFWRQSGGLAQTLADMDAVLPLYSRLTRGQGTGAGAAMRAEALLMRGEEEPAEILGHKALYQAEAGGQTAVCFCAELTLARAAILRGDAEACRKVLARVRRRGDRGGAGGARLAQLLEGFLTGGGADWLASPDRIRQNLYPAAVPFGLVIGQNILLRRGEMNRATGLGEAFLETAREPPMLLAQVYFLTGMAVAHQRQGRLAQAQDCLDRALTLALPDGIYLPFAERGIRMRLLLERQDQERVARILPLLERQARGMAKLTRQKGGAGQSLLTPREEEVALLAAEGLSNKEIAEKLFLSLSTVKTLLSRVYGKLKIQSRVQIRERL